MNFVIQRGVVAVEFLRQMSLWFSTGIKGWIMSLRPPMIVLANDFCDGMVYSAFKLLREGLSRVKSNPENSEIARGKTHGR